MRATVGLTLALCCLGCGDDGATPARRADAHRVPTDAARDAGPAPSDAQPGAGGDRDGGDRDGGNAPAPVVGEDYVDFGALLPERQVVQVAIDVPRDAFSLVVTVDPGLSARRIALLELRAPDGALLFDGNADGVQPFDPASARNAAPELPYSWMLPSASELELQPGIYHAAFYVGASALPGAGVHVDAVLARGDPAAPPGPLQLTVWLPQGGALSADGAAADPRLQAAFAAMREIYARAGIVLAPVSFADLSAGGAGAFATLDGDAEVAALLALLSERAGPERALDVVLVAELAAQPGATVLAEATSVPGAPAHPALQRRGAVIVALATLPADAQRAGALLAHECAHYLGLRHTSELDGSRHDPLADTPQCPPERASRQARDGTPLLSAEDCADLDGENLMFYTPPQSALMQDQLSPDQAFVLARNPLVR